MKNTSLRASHLILTAAVAIILSGCAEYSTNKPVIVVTGGSSTGGNNADGGKTGASSSTGNSSQSESPAPGGEGDKNAAPGTAGDTEEQKRTYKVTVVVARNRAVNEDISIPGVVADLPDHSVKVSPAIAGKLISVAAIPGQSVRKNQVIAQLDDRHLRDVLEQSKSAVDVAKANVKQCESTLAFAAENVTRQKRLVDAEVSAKKDVIAAESQAATARAQLEASRSQQHSAEVNVKQNETELTFTQVLSPLSGIVATRFLNAGDSTDPNTPIVQIVDLGRVVVNAQLPADSEAAISIGEHAAIKPAGQSTTTYSGAVKSISPVVDQQTNTVRIQLECQNPKGSLREGQAVNVAIIRHVNNNAVVIPMSAIVPNPDDPKKEMVYIVSGNKAHRIGVRTGQSLGKDVEILDGVSAGDKVISKDAYGLPNNSPVEISETHG